MMEIKGSFEFIEKRKAAYVVGCRFSIEKIKKRKSIHVKVFYDIS